MSAAAFKERHNAYALTRALGEEVENAKTFMEVDMPGRAADALGWVLKAIDANPAAREMVAQRVPALMREAEALSMRATKAAPCEIKSAGSTEWLSHDGQTEARVLFGQSAQGHHYALEVSRGGGEQDAPWSKPYPTAEAAKNAGAEARSRVLESFAPVLQRNAGAIWGSREAAGAAARAADGQAPRQRSSARQSA